MGRGSGVVAWLMMASLLVACGDGTSGANGAADAGGQAPAGVEVPPPAGATILAKVGANGGVTAEDFADAAARTPPEDGKALSIAERQKILESLVTEEALFQEAARRGLHRDAKVRKIMISLLMRKEVTENVKAADFSPEQMQAYFAAHQDEFVVPEKFQVMRIFLKVGEGRTLDQANTLAADLRAKIVANPESFKTLAQEHSDDPYKRRGGDLGFLAAEGKAGIDPAVVQRAFTMKVGEVSEPFEAGGGVNIVFVPQKRERVERTFEQMKGSVLRKLKNERYKELTEKYITAIRAKQQVEIDEAALAAAPVQAARPGPTSGEDGEHTELEPEGVEPEEGELE